ncbi:ATP-binding protein [Rhodoferax sp.]|uniref:sensor histidine kinase n=1 Tax=Rhodoferax sp. TaxID=50421 RepID=UPI0025ED3ED2|nr:ATP-binding protein [Rhodoferax sp.]MCM2339994.1 ATP-binding protein [Rhodoferax sp.]
MKRDRRGAQLFDKLFRRANPGNLPVRGLGSGLTIQRYLTRLIWISVVPLILLAAYLGYNSVRNDQSQRDQLAANVAQNLATAIDNELTARIQGLQLLAASPLANDAARREAFYQEAQGYHASFGSHVILADMTQQMLLNTRVPWSTALPILPRPKGRAAVPVAIETGQPAVGDLVPGPVVNEPLVAIVVPGQRHGKTAFLLLTTLTASEFQQRLQRVALPDGWALTLRDSTGAVIAQHAPAGVSAADALSRGARFTAASTRSPWSVQVEIPPDLYRAPIVAATTALALLVLGASLSGLLGGGLAARRLGRAVAQLAQPGVADAPPADIAEIDAVRALLDDAARQRAGAEAESTRLLAQVTESRGALLLALEEQKQAHAALTKSQRLLAETEQMGKVGGWEFDVATGKQTWTPEVYKIHEVDPGFDPTVDEGVNFYAPACRATIEQAVRRAIEQGEPFDLELEIITAKGHVRIVHTIGQADAQQHRVHGFFQDITERKRAELEVRKLNAELEQRVAERTAQLTQANQELDTFAYSVSHDLKSPLRGIDGYSALLQEECAAQLSADGRLFVDNIRQGARQMTTLIDDLLAYSRMERRTLRSVPLPLRELVQAVLAEQSRQIDQQGAEVRIEMPALVVLADRDGVALVLRNLLENALKFSGNAKPPLVEIGARDEGDACTLWVRDNGIGFDMQFHDRIFDIFQRLQRAEDYPGTGIGLALVSKAVTRMGGRVWAQSAPGAGATLYVSLPKYVAPPAPGAASNGEQAKED